MAHRVKRILKLLTFGGAVGGTAWFLRENDWEISTVGVMRFGRAALTVLSIVADYKMNLRGPDPNSEEYKKLKSEIHTRSALKLRELCCKNGGAFIKVGQHIGTLEYLLPSEYVKTMKVLHSDAPKSELSDLYKVIEMDLGTKVEEIFTSFSSEPVGTASLAQVHKATLKDGTVVAVKIQHPRVKAHSYVDIKTMEFLINRIAWVFPDFQYVWLAEETKKNLPLELDFLNEGRHCERVARLFKKFTFLKVPRIYWDLSSERVLTMEFCEGGKVDDRQYMKEHNISVNEVTRNLGKLYSEMIFVQGYVHCDPHPGNVLVNKTKQGTQIVLLDHGLYQTLTDDFRVNYSKLWMSLIKADMEGIKTYAMKLNAGNLYPLFACMLTARSWKSISSGIDRIEYTASEEQVIKDNAAQYFIEISEILNRVPRQLLLIMKTNDVLRGIEASLQVRSNASSFINMSRCCIRAVGLDDLRKADGYFTVFKIHINTNWQLCTLSFYEFFLWFQNSLIGQLLFRRKPSGFLK
ncbi:hypothetical protein CHS0354_029458 [Potamilus streckersoni]|uniref:Protein kinase domain-containing protein n=1 Tax=Potamilus streckersoni TaxID=2493646 RepID=A0AAE0SUN5_9BIVA|nr:hypothetical protein CHS0354_029458 [Potamilus streckersoni]